jgi:hypothetical protein
MGRLAKAKEKLPLLSKLMFLFALAISPSPEFNFLGIPKVRITDMLLPFILIVMTGGTAAMKGLAQKKAPRPFVTLMIAIVIWNLTCLLALGQARFTPGFFYIAKRLIFFLIYLIGFNLAKSGQRWDHIVKALLYTSPFLALTVSIDQAIHSNLNGYRASGIIKDQEGSTAYFFVLILGLAIALWPVASGLADRAALITVLAAGVKSLFATGTKGGIILFIVVAAYLLMKNLRQALPLSIVLLALISISWIFTPEGVQQRLERIENEVISPWTGMTQGFDKLDSGGDSVAERMVAANWVLGSLVPQSPIWGFGAGNKPLGFCDDYYVTELYYHGFVGLLLWICLQASLGYQLWRAQAIVVDPLEQAVSNGLFAVFIAMSVGGLTADTFFLIRPCEAFYLITGLVVGRTYSLGFEKRKKMVMGPMSSVSDRALPQFVPKAARSTVFRPRQAEPTPQQEAAPEPLPRPTVRPFRKARPEAEASAPARPHRPS